MPKDIVVLGPPGTGKTTAGVTTVKRWFDSGVGTGEVAYLAFTKAAARESASRVMDEDFKKDFGEQLPYFRTLHSLAYMGLRRAKPGVRLVTTADMKGFAKWSSMDGKYAVAEWEDMAEHYQRLQKRGKAEGTEWDDCLNAYTLSRISARNEDDLKAARVQMSNLACDAMGLQVSKRYQSFVSKYETYKEVNGLVDFTDMLEFALTKMEPINEVKKVIIDEAQDLSPLLFAIADKIFLNSEEIWWLGDDDQAIFRFSAADAAFLIDRARRGTKVFLRQTHRFGNEVVDLSKQIISRVSDRVKKEVLGAKGKEHLIQMTGSFQPQAFGDMLLLHRHVAGCQALGEAYIHAGVPFRNERGRDPLGAHARMLGYKALRDLADGKMVSPGAVTRLVDDLMPSMVLDERKGAGSKKTRLIVHGAKKKMQNFGNSGDMNLMDCMRAGILTNDGADVIRQKFFNVFKHSDDLEYYDRIVDNGYDLEGKHPVITTIHGSKGREAGKVVVFSEMGMKCWDDKDTEHRLAYVAATRTQRELEVCAESTLSWPRVTHYSYPIFKKERGAGVTPLVTQED